MATTNDLIPAVGYLRLSDARLEEAFEGRRERLHARAADLGWHLYDVIVENDLLPPNGDGTVRPASAWKRKRIKLPNGRVELRTIRPGFRDRLLPEITSGRARGVLAEDLDRVLRQPRDGEDLLDAVELAGATCRSLSGSLTLTDGGTNDERFIARVMAATASKGSADTSRRVAAARERLAGQSYGGGRRPYGYRPDPDAPKYHKTLIKVPAEAAVIEAAAADILDRKISLKAIARDLRERGEPTVTGTAWSAKTLRDVLIKPAVAGLAVGGKRQDGEQPAYLDGPWEPILERDVWERLREELTKPGRRTNTGNANEPRWLVSGFAVCGVCRGRTRVAGGRNRAPAYVGAECCHVRRNAEAVDDFVEGVVVGVLNERGADLLRPPPRPGVDARRLRAEARKLRGRKSAQMRLHAAGEIDDADLAAGMRAIRDRLAAVEAQLAASDQADPLAEFRDGQPAEAVWAGLGMPRRRAIVQAIIESVVIKRAGRRGGHDLDPDTVEVTPAPAV
jgi:DNA invertase Pin-like site-specific DNA recombinase